MEVWQKKDAPHVTVEAVRLTEANAVEVAAWCRGDLIEEIDPEHPEEKQPGINLETPSGLTRASLHMYVVKYGKNFFVEHVRRFEDIYKPQDRLSPPPESIGDAMKQRGFADPFGGTIHGRPI